MVVIWILASRRNLFRIGPVARTQAEVNSILLNEIPGYSIYIFSILASPDIGNLQSSYSNFYRVSGTKTSAPANLVSNFKYIGRGHLYFLSVCMYTDIWLASFKVDPAGIFPTGPI